LRLALVRLAERFPKLALAADPRTLTSTSITFGVAKLPVTW
jgi:hypothetical protein